MSFDRENDESNNGMQCLLLHYIAMNVNQRINHEIIKLIHEPIGQWDRTGHIALVSIIIIIDCDLLLANDHHSRGDLGSRGLGGDDLLTEQKSTSTWPVYTTVLLLVQP